MRTKRHSTGSVRYDKRRKTWNYLWYDGTVRRSKRIGTKQEYPTKAAAWKAVPAQHAAAPDAPTTGVTMQQLIARYEVERMPQRLSTARAYGSILRRHISPRWGLLPIADIQPRPVELWLRDLPLSPKSKTHVRGLMHNLLEFAMWSGLIDIGRNPISLVHNKGATTKTRPARSLTVEEFQSLLCELRDPVRTIALLSVCLGLRVSEALALRWADVDWLGMRLTVERGIVDQVVDTVKTPESGRTFDLSPDLITLLQLRKRETQFGEPADWIFASPFQIGRLPASYTAVLMEMVRAGQASGIGKVGTHTLRHTYRSWLDAVGTKISVQQKLMRHSDIRTTMNIYGDVVTDEMSTASQKVTAFAFRANGAQAERKPL